MKRLATILAGAALALAGTAATAGKTADKGEARLARMLEGRIAGEAVSCINTTRVNKLEVIDRVGLVYDAGDTIYVARAIDPRMLRSTDVLVTERLSPTRLCIHDHMRTVDRYDGFHTGVVFLSEFVPYTREG